ATVYCDQYCRRIEPTQRFLLMIMIHRGRKLPLGAVSGRVQGTPLDHIDIELLHLIQRRPAYEGSITTGTTHLREEARHPGSQGHLRSGMDLREEASTGMALAPEVEA